MAEDLKHPLNKTPEETGWYVDSGLDFARIDNSLDFGKNFHARGLKPNNKPYHFNVYWRAVIVVPEDGEYSYNMKSDDDSWVYIDGTLDASLHAKQGSLRKTVNLTSGIYSLEIYYTFRGRSGAVFSFVTDGNLKIYPWPVDCSLASVRSFAPGTTFSYPGSITTSGSTIYGEGITVLGAEFSYYTPASALYQVYGLPNIYSIVNEQSHYISSPKSFEAYGYRWEDIKTVSLGELNAYPRARLIKSPERSEIYYLYQRLENKWLKIRLTSPTVFVSYPDNYWGNVITVTQLDIDAYPDVRLIKTKDDPGIYYLENDTKHLVSEDVFVGRGFNPHEVVEVSQVHMDSYLIGEPLK
jgi:hypothetical protein